MKGVFRVGYILPITQFQYKDYQNRMPVDKQKLSYVEKPYKVFLDMEQKSDYDRKTHYEFSKSDKKKSYSKATVPKQIRTEPLDEKVTGKGMLFNEHV